MLDSNIWNHLSECKQMMNTKSNYTYYSIWNYLTVDKPISSD